METTVTCTARVAAPIDRVFGIVADYRSAAEVIEGLERLTPSGSQVTGVGARFDAVMQVGPRRVEAAVEIAELAENRTIVWASSGGDNRAIRFDMLAAEGETRVRLRVTYDGPDGLSGLVLAPVVEDMVRSKASDTLAAIAEMCRAA